MIAARHALVAGLVCAALARAAAGQTRKDPSAGEIVVTATRAVDGDSSGPLRTRWTARLARDPDDRAAALGLLTLARLTYDTADARRRMDALTAPGTPDDAIARYARLGEARVMFASTRWRAAAAAYAAIADAARAAHDSAAEARAALGAAWTAVVMWRPDSLHAWLARAEAVAPARDDAARGANRCVRADLPETPPDSASVWLRQ